MQPGDGELDRAGEGDFRIAIVGGGIAGLETLLALRALAGSRASLTLISDTRELNYLPLKVVQALKGDSSSPRDLSAFTAEANADFIHSRLEAVDVESKSIAMASGEEIAYDAAVICVGARLSSRFRNAPSLIGPHGVPRVEDLIQAAADHPSHRLAFIVPPGESWTLPIYELALMAARLCEERGLGVEGVVVTPEAGPLTMFGPTVSDRVYELLQSRKISMLPSTYAHEDDDGSIVLTPGGHALDAGAAVALPIHEGPCVKGLPMDAGGFIPIDNHARVRGCRDVYAAGDATNFPIKQGGLAAQQADAAAERIASDLGCLSQPHPFHPVLRGKFLLDEPTLYLRTDVGGGAGEGDISEDRLWWPPLKVDARYLGPLLAQGGIEPEMALDQPPLDVEVNLSGEWYRDPMSLDPYSPPRGD